MATDSPDQSGAVEEQPKIEAKKKVSPARNAIGWVLLVVVTGAGIMQVLAQQGYNRAVTRLNNRLPKEDAGADDKTMLPTREEAEKLIGKAPDGPLVQEGQHQSATYSWRGLRRKYVLKVYYSLGSSPSVVRTETE